jgi:small subunit ribosomal protein S20
VPIIKSARKRVRQEAKRRERNKALKTYMKNLQKKTLSLLSSADAKKEDLTRALTFYKSQLDKAWAKGIFKKNKSSRLKSKIDKLFSKKAKTENI